MWKIARRSSSLGIGLVLIAALAGSTGSTTSTPSSLGDVPPLPDGWIADEVAVPTDLGTSGAPGPTLGTSPIPCRRP